MADFGVTVVFSGLMLFLPPHGNGGDGEMVVKSISGHTGDMAATSEESNHGMNHYIELQMQCGDLVEWWDDGHEVCNCRETCKRICNSAFDLVPETDGNPLYAFPLDSGYEVEFHGLHNESNVSGVSFEPCHSVPTGKKSDKTEESCLPNLNEILENRSGAAVYDELQMGGKRMEEMLNGQFLIRQGKVAPLDPGVGSETPVQSDMKWNIKRGFLGKSIYRGRIPSLMALTGRSREDSAFSISLTRETGAGIRKITMKFLPPGGPQGGNQLRIVISNEPNRTIFCSRSKWELRQFKHFRSLFEILGSSHKVGKHPWPWLDDAKDRQDVLKNCKSGQAGNGPVYCYGGYYSQPPASVDSTASRHSKW